MKRSSGILMPIFALPGPWGIGCFDHTARSFAEKVAAAGFKYWQILPINPTSAGDSPYQGLSAYAGNPYFLDLTQLHEQHLLTAEELQEAQYPWAQDKVDYGWLYHTREALLHKAYARLGDEHRHRIAAFIAKNERWLPDYTLYRAIKKANGDRPWWEWEAPLRRHEPQALSEFADKYEAEIGYHSFVQYEFDRQWQALKADINALGVEIIGDMPIYVSQDSADAWSRTDLFEMDEDSRLLRVAGVPPDYFTADGQLWGNPLYRWDLMEKDGFAWWIDRIRTALHTFDTVRIDHFRGFESYWAVPAGDKTARNGQWEKGPAMKLFDIILKTFPKAPIIAEDLGDIDDDVRDFLNQTGLPGMKVMQFAFDGYHHGGDLPHAQIPNSVVYTGTHDNTTTIGWRQTLDPEKAQFANQYIRYTPHHPENTPADNLAYCRAFIKTLWISPANLAIAPIQDFLALDATARINTPGTSSHNWTFRLPKETLNQLDLDWIKQLNQTYYRAN